MDVMILIVAVCVGCYAVAWYCSPAQQMRRELAQHPQVAIAAATEGATVRLCGRVRLEGSPLVAPLSQRPCAAWQVVIREKRSSGRSSQWVTLVDEHEATDFYLEDQNGDCVEVRGSDTKLLACPDHRLRSGVFSGPTEEVQLFLAERGHDTQGLVFNKTFRAEEGIFEIGEEVVIAGTIRDLGDDPELPGQRRLRLAPLYGDWILASDHPKHRSAGQPRAQ